jgi:hypothetical protein
MLRYVLIIALSVNSIYAAESKTLISQAEARVHAFMELMAAQQAKEAIKLIFEDQLQWAPEDKINAEAKKLDGVIRVVTVGAFRGYEIVRLLKVTDSIFALTVVVTFDRQPEIYRFWFVKYPEKLRITDYQYALTNVEAFNQGYFQGDVYSGKFISLSGIKPARRDFSVDPVQ